MSAGIFLLIGGGEGGRTQLVSERQEIFSDGQEDQPPVPALPTFTPAAELLLKFGAQGSAEGEMDDARYIAVDPQGNIFAGDYSGGRVQKFDAQGNFLMLINVPAPDADSEVYTRGIGVDAQGNLYVARNGDILIYNGADGQLLNTIPSGWPDTYYDSLLVAGDTLYSTNGMAAADDILKLSPQGEILLHKPDVIESVDKDDPALNMQLAVDSQGQIYILSNFGPRIYIYDAQGTYLTRFGEEGSGRGQIDLSTNLLAIDQRDRLYVASSFRIDQFDTQGNYLGYTIDVYDDSEGGVPMGMTFDEQGFLYLICNNGKILKYQINSR
jgi:sugar lactone lactonase YvrE